MQLMSPSHCEEKGCNNGNDWGRELIVPLIRSQHYEWEWGSKEWTICIAASMVLLYLHSSMNVMNPATNCKNHRNNNGIFHTSINPINHYKYAFNWIAGSPLEKRYAFFRVAYFRSFWHIQMQSGSPIIILLLSQYFITFILLHSIIWWLYGC